MRILNIMLGRKKGGIEQAFLDYTAALTSRGHEVIALTHQKAAVLPALEALTPHVMTLASSNAWNPFTFLHLERQVKKIAPDVIITHGNRALILVKRVASHIPTVGVCHNYTMKHILRADRLFAITEDLRNHAVTSGFPPEHIFCIPNMITLKDTPPPPFSWRNPPVIGTMARFVRKKGLHIFIEALHHLKESAIGFQAVIGGTGEEEETLRALVSRYDLTSQVRFIGWVENKEAFYQGCDIFCLPSLHEPFGIVLLEAFLYGKSVVTSNAEGPREIAHHEQDVLMVEKGDSRALAAALGHLISTPELAAALACTGKKTVEKYSSEAIGAKMEAALRSLLPPT